MVGCKTRIYSFSDESRDINPQDAKKNIGLKSLYPVLALLASWRLTHT
jgi:hypothetical protein